MSRVVVVGAGVGGLAVAARLAAAGHRVTVLEQAAGVGGKLRPWRRAGFAVGTGPAVLTWPEVFAELFAATGGPLDAELRLQRLDPAVSHRFADGTRVDLPAGALAGAAAAWQAGLGGSAGAQWARLMRWAARVWPLTERSFLRAPGGRPAQLLRLAAGHPAAARTVAPWRTLRGLTSRLADPRLRQAMDRYAAYSGSDPRRVPGTAVLIPYLEQVAGLWHVRGGLHLLADALHQRAVDRGALVRTGCPVRRITLAGGRAAGVLLADGHRLPADLVVAAVDATVLYTRLLPGARRLRPPGGRSYSAFALLLGLAGRTCDLPAHNVLFPAAADAEFDDLRAGRPPADPTLLVTVTDDPAARPGPDREAWFVLANAPPQGPVDWTAPGRAEGYARTLLDRLAGHRLAVRDRLLVRQMRTPADIERETGSPGGAIYGTSSDGWRAAFLRPANRSPVDGLFLVGGSAHPGGGLPLVALSAATVAASVGPA